MNPLQLLQTLIYIIEVTISPPTLKILYEIGLYRPLDGITNPNPKYNLLCFLTAKFFVKRRKH